MRIVYFDIDSLRASHLGCYGYARATTPVIDSVAERGALFTNCFASDLPCLPSRTALFSGRFGTHTGVVGHGGTAARLRYPGDGHRTDPARLPLAMALNAGGYVTSSVSSFHERHLAWHFCAGWQYLAKPGIKIGYETADEVTSPALAWVDLFGEGEDWFLHVNLWDPHTPYRTPEGYGDPFADEPAPAWLTQERLDELRAGFGPRSARDVVNRADEYLLPRYPRELASIDHFKRWIDAYDTGIRYADEHVGIVLERLETLGVLDETLVVVSADHGENQGELNVFGDHSTANYSTGRVPLVAAGPGIPQGRHDELVYQLDLAPTWCELTGISVPKDWDGSSLVPLLLGDGWAARSHLVIGQGAWTCQRAVVTPAHILIRTYHAGLQDYPELMLFDLAADAHETNDLASDEPARAAELDGLLDDWLREREAGRDVEQDPMLTVLDEGGPYYPKLVRHAYVPHLRDTGRNAAADVVDARFAGVGDDGTRGSAVFVW